MDRVFSQKRMGRFAPACHIEGMALQLGSPLAQKATRLLSIWLDIS